jgi:hypothetical protein
MADLPPTLRIKIAKRRGKLPLLVCERADGTRTMAELTVGAAHDLGHYVVETTLGYRRAFYGLVARGMNIEDFNGPAASTRTDIPEEAVATEFIVGMLQTELVSGEPMADFNEALRRAMADGRRPMNAPVVSDADLATMRRRYGELVGRWYALEGGGTIELEWF